MVFFFFFFQAEDGIRDFHVTGVQTCALPISSRSRRSWSRSGVIAQSSRTRRSMRASRSRSEERRVGKECRSRWSRYDEKKNSGSVFARPMVDFGVVLEGVCCVIDAAE